MHTKNPNYFLPLALRSNWNGRPHAGPKQHFCINDTKRGIKSYSSGTTKSNLFALVDTWIQKKMMIGIEHPAGEAPIVSRVLVPTFNILVAVLRYSFINLFFCRLNSLKNISTLQTWNLTKTLGETERKRKNGTVSQRSQTTGHQVTQLKLN